MLVGSSKIRWWFIKLRKTNIRSRAQKYKTGEPVLPCGCILVNYKGNIKENQVNNQNPRSLIEPTSTVAYTRIHPQGRWPPVLYFWARERVFFTTLWIINVFCHCLQASIFALFLYRLCFATVHKRSISQKAINLRFVSGLVEFIGDADEPDLSFGGYS